MRPSARNGVLRGPRPQDRAIRLLFVCTGDLCRSPLAERLFRTWLLADLGDGSGSVVESAGTAAAAGPMDALAAQALVELGGSRSGADAKQLHDGATVDVDWC